MDRDKAIDAFAEPRRRAILELVSTREMPAGQVCAAFPEVSQSTVSQHLKVLRETGLVFERRDGTRRLYRANADALEELQRYLSDLWASSLSVAKTLAEDAGGLGHRADAG
ncbi:ArsR/SmtB family transcription factor [Microbacterium gorillae]|uniref:ArsR/SmtB family transcription factor n=1 Tax=Microbacterium gorillae TaxID=1231063 RepID=UPI000B32A757|nr:metalloregulator ArsR/SmtB family transcription factor [Microbacterium gorillae]